MPVLPAPDTSSAMSDNWPTMARFPTFSPESGNPFSSSPSYSNGNLTTARTMPDQSTIDLFKDRHNRLMSTENEKNKLIEDLLCRLELTEDQYQRSRLDHDREIRYNREGQMRETQLQNQLRGVKGLMDRNAFVVVLLDGDGMIFSEQLLQQGEKGGKEAASQLWGAMNEFVHSALPHLSSPKILARIYANVKGLGDVLQMSGIIDRATVFEDFARGFNGSKLLFDFIDVGNGKDKADDKITEIFKLYLQDIHCHQILLGCSHDNGYARLLDDTMGDAMLMDHITLLEGVPFERELANLRASFRTTKFDNMFRDTKLATPYQLKNAPGPIQRPLQTIFANIPIGSPLAQVPSNSTTDEITNSTTTSITSKSNTPAPTWASMTAAPFIPSASSPAARSSMKNGTGPLKSTPGINRNRLGQRVDDLDESIPNEDIKRVKKLKLCNVYYLNGADACNNARCTHDHDYDITKNDLKTLRQVARMTPCYFKTECDDPKCIYGHRCPQSQPNSKECWYKEDCRFAGWGHGIDTRICKTTKV